MVSDPEIICVEKCRHYSVNVISLFFFIFFYFSLLFELYGLFLVRRRAWHVAENEENKLTFFLATKFVIFFIKLLQSVYLFSEVVYFIPSIFLPPQ